MDRPGNLHTSPEVAETKGIIGTDQHPRRHSDQWRHPAPSHRVAIEPPPASGPPFRDEVPVSRSPPSPDRPPQRRLRPPRIRSSTGAQPSDELGRRFSLCCAYTLDRRPLTTELTGPPADSKGWLQRQVGLWTGHGQSDSQSKTTAIHPEPQPQAPGDREQLGPISACDSSRNAAMGDEDWPSGAQDRYQQALERVLEWLGSKPRNWTPQRASKLVNLPRVVRSATLFRKLVKPAASGNFFNPAVPRLAGEPARRGRGGRPLPGEGPGPLLPLLLVPASAAGDDPHHQHSGAGLSEDAPADKAHGRFHERRVG